jgi:hypothetical protein
VAKKISSKSSHGGGRSRRRRLAAHSQGSQEKSDDLEIDMASSATVQEMPEDEPAEDDASVGSSSGSSSGATGQEIPEDEQTENDASLVSSDETVEEMPSGVAHIGMPIVPGAVAALCVALTLFF